MNHEIRLPQSVQKTQKQFQKAQRRREKSINDGKSLSLKIKQYSISNYISLFEIT